MSLVLCNLLPTSWLYILEVCAFLWFRKTLAALIHERSDIWTQLAETFIACFDIPCT